MRTEYSIFRTTYESHGSFGAPRARHRKPRARVASDPAGPQPRAMKFGHRFQQVIEQTHPSVSDQVRSRAARHPFSRWRETKSRIMLVGAASRARRPRGAPGPPLPRLASRASSREMPRGHTLGRFPTPHPSVRRVRCRTGHGTRRSVRTGDTAPALFNNRRVFLEATRFPARPMRRIGWHSSPRPACVNGEEGKEGEEASRRGLGRVTHGERRRARGHRG